MSNPTYGTDGLLASTINHYMPTLEDQIFGAHPFLFILKAAGRIMNFTGANIVQPLMYAEAPNVGSYADSDTFADAANTGLSAAEFPFKQFYGSVKFTGIELAKNSGKEAILSLLESRLTQLEMTMASQLNADLFLDGSGNSDKDFYGLAAIVDDTNPSFGNLGGIDRSTNVYWRATENAAAGALSLALMRTAYNDPSEGRDEPTNIITTQAAFESYEALMDSSVVHESRVLGDAGFQNLMFKGAPMVFDDNAQAQTMYFLNIKYLTLAKLNDVWFQVSDWLRPVNQDVQYKNITLYGNLIPTNCNRQAKLTGITNG